MTVHHNVLMEFFFFFNDTATTEIYTLSLHDALPIFKLKRLVSILPILTSRLSLSKHLAHRSEERFSRNAETDLVCRLLLEKKNKPAPPHVLSHQQDGEFRWRESICRTCVDQQER